MDRMQDCEVRYPKEGSVRSVRRTRGVSCQELRSMLPTVIILLFTVIIIFTVIPYAFISVMKQMEAAQVSQVKSWLNVWSFVFFRLWRMLGMCGTTVMSVWLTIKLTKYRCSRETSFYSYFCWEIWSSIARGHPGPPPGRWWRWCRSGLSCRKWSRDWTGLDWWWRAGQ